MTFWDFFEKCWIVFQVFVAGMTWIMSDVGSRRRHIFEVVKCIRLPLVPSKRLESFMLQCTDISLKVALDSVRKDLVSCSLDKQRMNLEWHFQSLISMAILIYCCVYNLNTEKIFPKSVQSSHNRGHLKIRIYFILFKLLKSTKWFTKTYNIDEGTAASGKLEV